MCQGLYKLLILGMVMGNPCKVYINPYYWVDEHALPQGNNGSLDSELADRSIHVIMPLPLVGGCGSLDPSTSLLSLSLCVSASVGCKLLKWWSPVPLLLQKGLEKWLLYNSMQYNQISNNIYTCVKQTQGQAITSNLLEIS